MAYSHNTANEYTSIDGTSVSHDAAGNLSADPNGYTYEYDHDNRLTKIKKDSGTTTVAEFTYDALGRRIEAIDSLAAATTRYYYDGWRVLSETNAAGVNQRDYVYGNYLDELLIKRQDTADLYYAHNHLYSPVALINASGTVLERYEYDVYGKPTIYNDDFSQTYAISQHDNPVMFTGQRLDTLDDNVLKLMYYKGRYYNSAIGRFLQRDPIGIQDGLCLFDFFEDNGTPYMLFENPSIIYQYILSACLYEYNDSIPIGATDPYGLFPEINFRLDIGIFFLKLKTWKEDNEFCFSAYGGGGKDVTKFIGKKLGKIPWVGKHIKKAINKSGIQLVLEAQGGGKACWECCLARDTAICLDLILVAKYEKKRIGGDKDGPRDRKGRFIRQRAGIGAEGKGKACLYPCTGKVDTSIEGEAFVSFNAFYRHYSLSKSFNFSWDFGPFEKLAFLKDYCCKENDNEKK